MSDDKRSVTLSEEKRNEVQAARRHGESFEEAVERLIDARTTDDGLSKRLWFSFLAGIFWVVSLVAVSELVAALVGGFYIAVILWLHIWTEIRSRF